MSQVIVPFLYKTAVV